MSKKDLTYQNYTAVLDIDPESGLIFGQVIDIKDTIAFQGKTFEEAIEDFRTSVDAYLRFCEELDEKPEKPFSGKLPYRTTPETHRMISLASAKQKKSINSWMDEVLANAAQKVLAN